MKKISQIRGDTGREGLQQVTEEIRNTEETEESGTKKEKISEKAVVKNSNIFITICKYIIKGTGYLCLFLVPILSYYLFEYVTGNLANISAFMTALNICWVYVLYLILTGITGTTRISVPVGSAVLLIISFAETFVVGFRDRPIMIWDVLAVRTAMTVSGNYAFVISDKMVQAAKAVVAANIILWFFPVHVKGLKNRLLLGVSCVGTAFAFGYGFFHSIVPAHQMGINMWAVNDTYESCGYILSTAMSFQYVVKKPPAEYSQGRLVDLGIEGFWNFSHYDLSVPYPDVVVENVHLGDSLMSLGYRLRNQE